jgi:hypothetical protein
MAIFGKTLQTLARDGNTPLVLRSRRMMMMMIIIIIIIIYSLCTR